jgi:hypothetical protein
MVKSTQSSNAILIALEQRQMRLMLHSLQVSPSDLCMAFL